MSKKIIWIASYPKSGNTLVRAILASLFFTKDGIFSFEILNKIQLFEHAQRLSFIKEENIEDYNKLSDLKILSKYWIKMQSKKNLSLQDKEFCFLKTHSAQLIYFDNYFTDIKRTLGFIYIIRDPRDVAVSYARYSKNTLDETILHMTKNTTAIDYATKNKTSIDYYQDTPENKIKPTALISRWDVHVKSWELFRVPNLVLRYENLIKKKKEIIYKIINFFEKNYNFKFHNIDHKIENIITSTDFETLKKNEKKYGFDEAIKNQSFFNVGKSQQWKTQLNPAQKNLIENEFKEEMVKFKYL